MKRPLPHREPARLTDKDASVEAALLRSAGELSPPAGAQERIWARLREPHPRLVEQPETDAPLVELLRSASEIEPPVDAQARIWQRLLEEARARRGIADPPRLLERWPFLARAAALEPPFGRQTRILQSLFPTRRPRFAFAVAGLSLAAAAALLVFTRPVPASRAGTLNLTAGNEVRLVHTADAAGLTGLHVGDSVELSGAQAARWQLSGVGDCVLDGSQARVTLAASDEHGVRLELDRGRIAIHANKRSHAAPLVIRSRGVDVQVVGTILAVEALAGGVEVSVREGLVRVTAPGHEAAFVGAGQHWSEAADPSSPWAGEAMKRLATTPPEAAAVVVASGEGTPAEPALPHAPISPAPRAAAPAPASHPHLTRPVEYAARITPDQESSITPVSAEPPLESALGGTLRVPEGSRWNLDDEATAQWASTPAAQIESAIRQMPRNGPEDLRNLAIAFQALSTAMDAPPDERLRARSHLAQVLDDELGHPAQAVEIRRTQLSGLDGDDRSLARVEILADLVEMGRDQEAIDAAIACVRDCNAEHRVFAQVLQANLLIKAGRLDEARAIAKEAVQTEGAYAKTAFFFSQRAQLFGRNSQRERARFAAHLALKLDPRSPQEPQLRALAR